MALDKLITPKLLRYMNKGGAAMIFLVAFGLFFNYYKVINLDNIPIPYLTVGLWFYLIINAGIATPFHYLKKKSNEAGFCPKCGKPLKMEPKFYCEDCGEIEFKKRNA